jgi:peptidoglycan/LPS O-acetylase OafA/YrhL
MDQVSASINKRFTVLDSFRGVFALCVVVFHMHYVNSISELAFFRHSDLFVDFFFVLSGFVLAHSYAFKKELSFKRFTLSRFFRIFPLHIVTLLFFIIFELVKLYALKYGITFSKPPFSAENDPSEIIPNLLLLQSWTTYTNGLSFNYPSWSISIEFYIYLIFYTTLIIKGLLRYLLWFLIASVATWLFINGYLTSANILSNSVLRGLSGFFTGTFTYVLYLRTYEKIKLQSLAFSIFELLLFVFILYTISTNFNNKGIVIILLFSISIYVFAFEKGVLSAFLSTIFFKHLGKLSYSIYMTHASLLLVFLTIYMALDKILNIKPIAPLIGGTRVIDFGSSMANNSAIVVVLTTVLITSYFTNKYIELPSQKAGRNLIDKLSANNKADQP